MSPRRASACPGTGLDDKTPTAARPWSGRRFGQPGRHSGPGHATTRGGDGLQLALDFDSVGQIGATAAEPRRESGPLPSGDLRAPWPRSLPSPTGSRP